MNNISISFFQQLYTAKMFIFTFAAFEVITYENSFNDDEVDSVEEDEDYNEADSGRVSPAYAFEVLICI